MLCKVRRGLFRFGGTKARRVFRKDWFVPQSFGAVRRGYGNRRRSARHCVGGALLPGRRQKTQKRAQAGRGGLHPHGRAQRSGIPLFVEVGRIRFGACVGQRGRQHNYDDNALLKGAGISRSYNRRRGAILQGQGRRQPAVRCKVRLRPQIFRYGKPHKRRNSACQTALFRARGRGGKERDERSVRRLHARKIPPARDVVGGAHLQSVHRFVGDKLRADARFFVLQDGKFRGRGVYGRGGAARAHLKARRRGKTGDWQALYAKVRL